MRINVQDPNYEVLLFGTNLRGINIALVDRGIDFQTYVVAWDYDTNDGTWGQGHYYDRYEDAFEHWVDYFQIR